MDAIFNLLQQYRLESYYNQFLQMGVKDEQDFVDGVTDEDLHSLGEGSEYGINMNHLQSKVKILHVSGLWYIFYVELKIINCSWHSIEFISAMVLHTKGNFTRKAGSVHIQIVEILSSVIAILVFMSIVLCKNIHTS